MKAQFIKFDKKRPVFFGFAAIAKFEELTGEPMAKMGEVLAEGKMDDIIKFAYAGLYGGAKKTKKDIDFEIDDVINWLDEIEDLEIIFNTYMQCMPVSMRQEVAAESSKKK